MLGFGLRGLLTNGFSVSQWFKWRKISNSNTNLCGRYVLCAYHRQHLLRAVLRMTHNAYNSGDVMVISGIQNMKNRSYLGIGSKTRQIDVEMNGTEKIILKKKVWPINGTQAQKEIPVEEREHGEENRKALIGGWGGVATDNKGRKKTTDWKPSGQNERAGLQSHTHTHRHT